MKYLNLLLAIFVSSFLLFSCRPKFDEASWEVNALTPIAQSNLSIQNILSDSIVNIQSDSSVSIVFTNEIYTFGINSLIAFRDTVLPYTASIEKLELGDQSLAYPISLGQLASNPEAGIAGDIIRGAHGFSLPIPPIGDPTPLSSGEIDINGTDLFETMQLDSGFMDLSINNGLPIDITNLIFQLKNRESSETLIQDTFPLITSGEVVNTSYDLHGETIDGRMVAQIIQMSSPGTGETWVPIDTSDALVAEINIRDVKPYSATAIFPAQNIVDKADEMPMKGLGSIHLSEMKIRTAVLEIDAISTIGDSMFYTFNIPGALKDGEPFSVSQTVPPGTAQNPVSTQFKHPFNGYTLDLRGFGPIERELGYDVDGNGIINADTINTYVQFFAGRIDSTGEIVSLSKDDSLVFEVRIVDMIGDYGLGFLGKDTLEFGPEVVDFNFLSGVTDGSIDLEDVNVSIDIANSIGADAKISIDNLVSINSRTGNRVTLNNNNISQGIQIDPAELTGGSIPYSTETSSITLDNNNSNIEEFVENLPNQLEYNVTVEQNSLINPSPDINEILNNPPNFIYYNGGLDAAMNIEIPLHFASNQLTLIDTSDFNINPPNQNNIQSGTLTLIIQNGFPVNATCGLKLLDDMGNELIELFSDELIQAAELGSNQKVRQNVSSEISFSFNSADINSIFEASQLVIDLELNHPTVKIYDYYSIDVQLTSDFNYIINQ